MYDDCSWVAQVHLSPAAFTRFRESPGPAGDRYSDWLPWLESKDWQGKNSDLPATRLVESITSNGSKDFCEQAFEEFCIQDYEPESQTFTLFWFEHNINYGDLLEFMNAFRQIADFKDIPADEDFLAIGYEDWLPDETELVLQILPGSSNILSPESPGGVAILKRANELAQACVEKLASKFE